MIDSTTIPDEAVIDGSQGGEAASATVPLASGAASDEANNSAEAASAPAATAPPKPKRKVRRIVRKKKDKKRGKDADADVVDPILLEKVMNESCLPKAYTFEIVKTLKRINQILQEKHTANRARHKQTSDGDNNIDKTGVSVHIALQMPEGLLLYATVLSDVLQRLVAATNKDITINGNADQLLLRVSVLGDVTYGACCVDDLGAKALGCDLLVHYGHSCLVPIQHTVVPCLYVFVEITIDVPHLVECFHQTILGLRQHRDGDERAVLTTKPHVYLMGTIQFRHALMEARRLLRSEPYEYNITIPQAKPLSPGEVLGCTSPVLAEKPPAPTKPRKQRLAIGNGGINGGGDDIMDCCPKDQESVVLFVADGRFHLESTMISNPHIFRFYRYDPYPKTLTEESYDHIKMKSIRYEAIEKARLKIRAKKLKPNGGPAVFGIILGTLGRQGNPALLTKLRQQIQHHKLKSFVILASEITPSKLALFRKKVDAWVQIACPRLSVDWGHHLSGDSSVPVLNPYELFSALNPQLWRGGDDQSYPMDYYSQEGGPWSNYGDDDNRGRQYRTPTALAATNGVVTAAV